MGDDAARGNPSRFGAVAGLSMVVESGALRGIRFAGEEVVRLIDYPIRDAGWGTLSTETVEEAQAGDSYDRVFRTSDGAFEGRLRARVSGNEGAARLVADLEIAARRDTVVNRAGFIILHPLAGVAGAPLRVRHPDGSLEEARFPAVVSAAQPVRDIAGLAHRVGAVEVAIDVDGEVFEMEDQRNWTDASFKTYCRPLSLPRPYTLRAGDTVRQSVTVSLSYIGAAGAGTGAGPETATARPAAVACVMPEILLAHESAVTGAPHPQIAVPGCQGVLLRVAPGNGSLPDRLPDAAALAGLPVTLELVTAGDPSAAIAASAGALRAAGLEPAHVVALPAGYLASHQPEGPWPDGPRPDDLLAPLRQAFPGAKIGGGMLTNFTEFNRCPPDPAGIDFATFGTTAIVHAADDASVIETLEAIGHVIESAQALVPGRALRLGLMSIGMRSNPYGAGVVPNPEARRLPMAMDDPRQRTAFAAAFAVGLAAACARGGVAAFSPAMTAGPLGMAGDGGPWPIWHAVAALAALSGAEMRIEGGPAAGLLTLRGAGRRGVAGVVANLGPGPAEVEGPAVAIPDRAAPDWIDHAGPGCALTLAPMTAAILTGTAA